MRFKCILLFILRRNEQIIGLRAFLTKQPGGTMTVTGDDPKKFAAAMVEYSKEKVKHYTISQQKY